jgi:hypothetical protein
MKISGWHRAQFSILVQSLIATLVLGNVAKYTFERKNKQVLLMKYCGSAVKIL